MNEEYSASEAFSRLGLSDVSLRALAKKGFREPTEIQKACIPLLLDGSKDVVGQAQTGTGKTAAFALPILELIDAASRQTQALVLTPTRELAIQVADEIESLKGERRIAVAAIYGGASYETQFRLLKAGCQIIVGTPGRIQDHLERGTLDLGHLQFAVLDEADEMLDMGFIEDIGKILSQTNSDKRMLLFSATMPAPILNLALNFMRDYEIVRISSTESTENLTSQYYCLVREADKTEALRRIIDSCSDFYAIVFCKTKLQCEEIGHELSQGGYPAEALHGDLSQKQRETILQKLREHRISILVATDVAARGIDINDLTHVINYSVPGDAETYTHRIGRTGRAGKSGTAITFVSPSEKRRFSFIQKAAGHRAEEYQLPGIDELIKIKKQKIIASVMDALDGDSWNYKGLSSALLSAVEPEALVRTLLHLHWGGELDRNRYREIEAPATSGGKATRSHARKADGTARLFIAKGRSDRFTKRTLANALIAACRVRNEDLNDIQVMDDFSFVNVPEYLAGRIISTFRNQGEDGRPLVTRAREEDVPRSGAKKRKSNAEGRRSDRHFHTGEDWSEWKGPRRKKKKEGEKKHK